MKVRPVEEVDARLVAGVLADARQAMRLHAEPTLLRAWRIDNPYSTVWRLELGLDHWRGRFFAKMAKSAQVNRLHLLQQFRVEHAALERLAAASGSAPVQASAVRALALYEDLPALVTQAAEGLPLRRLFARHTRIWSRPAQHRVMTDWARQAGEWLRWFQDLTDAGLKPFPAEAHERYLAVRLKRLQQLYPSAWQAAGAEGILAGARWRMSELNLHGVATCGRHNDFASHNMIAGSSGGLRILDFQAYDTGPASFDACNFWLELELLKLDPTHSVELLAQMQQAFLSAYGRIQPGQPAFELARVRYTVNRLLNELDRGRGLQRFSLRRLRTARASTAWLRHFAARATGHGPRAPSMNQTP